MAKQDSPPDGELFTISCDCGCGGAIMHGIDMQMCAGGRWAELTLWSGRGYQFPYTFREKLKNAWRYLFVYDTHVYCDDVMLRKDGVIKLRDACDKIIEEMDEFDKTVILPRKKLEDLYKELIERDAFKERLTAEELADAVEYLRNKKE